MAAMSSKTNRPSTRTLTARALLPDTREYAISGTRTKTACHVGAPRIGARGSTPHCKDADIALDPALAARRDTFNPAASPLAALSAGMPRGIARVAPMHRMLAESIDPAHEQRR